MSKEPAQQNRMNWKTPPGIGSKIASPIAKNVYISPRSTNKNNKRKQKVEWREYWDFLDAFIDMSSEEGLQKLENHLAQRTKDAESKKKTVNTMATATVALDEVCSALEKLGLEQQSTNPYTCIEIGQAPPENLTSGAKNSSDEDLFYSDVGESDVESDCWYTPQGSPKLVENEEPVESDSYRIYVYGNEPTKRDLDVLNAIFHTEIDSRKYPHIDAWKQALLRFPNEEMDYFPSPAVIKKSHVFNSRNEANKSALSKQMSSKAKPPNTSLQPKTPLHPFRGIFSSYRENIELSPISSSPGNYSKENINDDSNYLPLLNMSTAE